MADPGTCKLKLAVTVVAIGSRRDAFLGSAFSFDRRWWLLRRLGEWELAAARPVCKSDGGAKGPANTQKGTSRVPFHGQPRNGFGLFGFKQWFVDGLFALAQLPFCSCSFVWL